MSVYLLGSQERGLNHQREQSAEAYRYETDFYVQGTNPGYLNRFLALSNRKPS